MGWGYYKCKGIVSEAMSVVFGFGWGGGGLW